jgi:hypothetical protein
MSGGVSLARGATFFPALVSHLRQPLTVEAARAILRRRLERREADFLSLMRGSVFGNRPSPYRPLLERAGCEYGDLAAMVQRDGVEGALERLLREGVYLTVAETKGSRPAVRGSVRVAADLVRLRTRAWLVNEPTAPDGASRWAGLYRAMLADTAVSATLFIDARRGATWHHATWNFVRLSTNILWLMRLTGPGYSPDRWFTRVDPARFPAHRRLARLARWLAARAGARIPIQEYSPLEDPTPIIEWMTERRRTGGTPHLQSTVSALVGLAQETLRRGRDLEGVQLLPSGEPLTSARLAALRAAGAEVVPAYGAKEAGQVAWGCLAPTAADDMHLSDDRFAVIQPGAQGSRVGFPPNALLFSSLRAAWPLVLLNVSLGDQAVIERRSCGCPLGRAGWQAHVRDVRSFDKLKVASFAVGPAALVQLIEQVLPGRFGGAPTDFQLVEEDADVVAGHQRIRLLVHPRVGPVDAGEATEAFLGVVRASGALVDDMWQNPRWFSVERRAPHETVDGKVYHVHRMTRVDAGSDDGGELGSGG